VRVLLDTNILLRNALQDDPRHQEVRQAVLRLTGQGAELHFGTQNAVEFWVVVTRPVAVNGIGLPADRAGQEVAGLFGPFTLLPDPPDLVTRWLELCTRYRVLGRQAHDTRLVALMLAHQVTYILTLNAADFARYTEITVLQPADV
jgi:predicted nucleic acid-binding protein